MRIGAGAAGAQGQRKWFPSSPEGLFCHVEEFARVPSAKGATSKASGPGQERGVSASVAYFTNDHKKHWETGL